MENNDDERSVFARPRSYFLVMTEVQRCVIIRALLEKSEEDNR